MLCLGPRDPGSGTPLPSPSQNSPTLQSRLPQPWAAFPPGEFSWLGKRSPLPTLPSSAAAGNSGDCDRDVPVGSAAWEGTFQSVPYIVLNECFDMQLFQSVDLSALQVFYILYSSFLFWLGGTEERAVNFQ